MSGNKDLRKAKHEAYQKKQAAKGETVVKWIFGVIDSPGRYLCHLCSFYRIICIICSFYCIHRK